MRPDELGHTETELDPCQKYWIHGPFMGLWLRPNRLIIDPTQILGISVNHSIIDNMELINPACHKDARDQSLGWHSSPLCGLSFQRYCFLFPLVQALLRPSPKARFQKNKKKKAHHSIKIFRLFALIYVKTWTLHLINIVDSLKIL